MGVNTLQAQRSKQRRVGTLSADSLRQKHIADSLALIKKPVLSIDSLSPVKEETTVPLDSTRFVQRKDSLMNAKPAPLPMAKKTWAPKPAKSLWLALVIPGAGQIYNRKYWKIPIVYGGFVGCAYAYTWNNGMYNDYMQAYQDIMSDDPARDSYKNFLPNGIDVNSNLTYYQELFRTRKDRFRRQRDLSVIATIGVYILSVVDAYVDAELSDFDISNDLSMTFGPTVFYGGNGSLPQGIGLRCTINF